MIPVSRPVITEEDKKVVKDTIDSGWISSSGPNVAAFEKKWAKYCKHKYGIACSSGTAALEACIAGFDFPPGKNVIVPNGTIVSCKCNYRAGLSQIMLTAAPLDGSRMKIGLKTLSPLTQLQY